MISYDIWIYQDQPQRTAYAFSIIIINGAVALTNVSATAPFSFKEIILCYVSELIKFSLIKVNARYVYIHNSFITLMSHFRFVHIIIKIISITD